MGDTEITTTKQELQVTIDQLIEEMKKTEVTTDQEYDFLGDWLRRNKASQKAVDLAFEDERIEKKAAYDAVLEAKREFIKPLEDSEKIARQKMTAYATVKEKARREAQAKLDEQARKEAEDKRIEKAQELSDKGKIAQADALLNKSLRVSAPKVAAPMAKTREVWRVEIVDQATLLRGIADGTVSADYVTINTSALVQAAQALKAQFSVPGVKAYPEYVPVL